MGHSRRGAPIVRTDTDRAGEVLRVRFNGGHGNILTIDLLRRLHARVERALSADDAYEIKLLVFEGVGENFSFGASVDEHVPEKMPELLDAFHGFVSWLEERAIPTAAITRGRCLGGGLELACWCGLVIADPSTRLGFPEIELGVFPPLAPVVLPGRVGEARATQLLLSGTVISAEEAVEMGLVDRVSSDPDQTLAEWFDTHLANKSALSLRFTWRAARMRLRTRLQEQLPKLESLYLNDLMVYDDPKEGIRAFLDKRPPEWTHR